MSKQRKKNIVVAVTGGIAAYKTCEVVRCLKKQGHAVHVIMTKNACEFITPLTLQTLSANPVVVSMFDLRTEADVGHIKLADEADLVLVCPATANMIAKYSHGICDDFVSTVLLATTAPIMMVPAMNVNMWQNVATQENVKLLKKRGVKFIGPAKGDLACGYKGEGRMTDPNDIVLALKKYL